MPLRIYDNNDWQSPTSINIYDGSWRTAKVGYVYEFGAWRVIFPDPIIPSITSIFAGAFGDRYEVNWEVRLINCDYVEAYLYSGTTQTNLLSTQTIQVDENNVIDTRIEFGGLANNTTYNIKLIGYSITENTTTVFSGPITTTNVIIPTVNITSMVPNANLASVQINWVSTNQYFYEISIWSVADGVRRFGPTFPDFPPTTSQSYTANFQQQPNTQYRVELRIYSDSVDTAEDIDFYTTPSTPAPSYSNFTVTASTCNSLTVSWNAQNYTSGTIEIWTTIATPERVPGKGSLVASHSFTSLSSRTFTGLSSSTQYAFTLTLNGTTTITSDYVGSFGSILPSLTDRTIAASANAPTNFTGSSNFYGSGVSLSWTASTANCTTITGYNVQYKLTSSSTWLTLVNGITATSANTTLYVTLTANTSYDFRVQATSGAGPSGYTTTTVVTNNNPYSISVYTLPLGTTTFTSVTVYGQLKNISGNDSASNGVSLSFSATANRGTFSSTSASTNTNGLASVTYTPNSTTGNIIFTVTGTGLVQGTYTMSVSLSPGLTPILSTSRTNFGYDVTHSNYNSSYSYTGTVNNGGFNFDGIWGDSFYTIVIPPINTALPVASRNALVSISCTSGTWTAQPSATTTVTSSRTGYSDASASVSNFPTGTLSYSYTWYYGNGELLGTGQTRSITSAMRGRNVYCIVVATRTGGTAGFQAQSNTISIPA